VNVQPVTVLIADDHPVVRAGIRALIGTDPGLTVLADTGTPCISLPNSGQTWS
jgi:DNA-binding NarL/FixJ family response regulator